MYFLQNSIDDGSNATLANAVMAITNTGSVGIGLINPSSKLHISGSGSGSQFQISSTVSSSIFFVSGSGNIGIGTTTPAYRLTITGPTASFHAGLTTNGEIARFSAPNGFSGSIFLGRPDVSSEGLTLTYDSTNGNSIQNTIVGSHIIQTANVERMRITSAGNVSIGLTNPSAVLHVSGSGSGSLMQISSHASSSIFFVSGSGNIGIGTTTPQRLLHLTGSGDTYIRVDGNNIQSLFGTDNIGTYIGQQGANDLRLITNAAERMRITSGGNVGIGTTSPAYQLQVLNTIGLRANSVDFQAIKGTGFGYSPGSYKVVLLGSSASADFTTVSIGYDPAGNANGSFNGNGTEVLFRRGVQFVTPNSANNNYYLTNLVLYDGNVGIGTTTPSYKLDIRNDIAASTSLEPISLGLYNGSDGGSAIYFRNSVNGQSKISFGVEAVGSGTDDTYLGFSTGGNTSLSERMRITSAGVVTLGNTSYAPRIQFRTGGSTAYSATINTDSKNDYISINGGDSTGYASGADIGLVGANRYGTATAGQLELGAGSATNNTNYGYIAFYTANTLRMQISFNGAIGTTAGGTNIYNPSDIRLKRNIIPISYGLNEILALNPSKFNWKEKFAPSEEDKDMLGFIAQEVQTIIPEAVESFGQDVHVNTDNIEYTVENPLRVNEKFIIPVLVKAIQELKAELDELKNK
jgi:hypothetical protein